VIVDAHPVFLFIYLDHTKLSKLTV